MTPYSETTDPVTVLSDDESWDLIAAVHLGRLVTVVDGRPEIFPVNFVVQRRTVLFRTAEGTKLFGTVMNDQVLFEADDHDVAGGLERHRPGQRGGAVRGRRHPGRRAGGSVSLDRHPEAAVRARHARRRSPVGDSCSGRSPRRIR